VSKYPDYAAKIKYPMALEPLEERVRGATQPLLETMLGLRAITSNCAAYNGMAWSLTRSVSNITRALNHTYTHPPLPI
jgi:hypothetical protein